MGAAPATTALRSRASCAAAATSAARMLCMLLLLFSAATYSEVDGVALRAAPRLRLRWCASVLGLTGRFALSGKGCLRIRSSATCGLVPMETRHTFGERVFAVAVEVRGAVAAAAVASMGGTLNFGLRASSCRPSVLWSALVRSAFLAAMRAKVCSYGDTTGGSWRRVLSMAAAPVESLSWPPPASAAGPRGSSSVCILPVNFTGRWVCYYEEPFAWVPFPFPEGFNANASPQSQTPRLGSTPPLSTRKHPTTAPRLNLRGGLRSRGAA
mmetsp:Transcript_36178/g.90317  ORF Transcript_36178/g.90317 Transcript_36178/m.90317 type:complete len:269 (-) Transcript_36178:23-829(-)